MTVNFGVNDLWVKVKLYVNLRKFDKDLTEDGELILESDINTVEDVVKKLGIDPDLVMIVAVNGHKATFNTILNDGDLIAFFPSVGGG